jgi:hypothetical protein
MIQILKTVKIPSDFLEALRLSMNYGFISKNEIWDWAIKVIQLSDNYDSILLDLINGKEPDGRQIDFIIRKRTENKKTEMSFRLLISLLNKIFSEGKISSREVAKKLYDFSLELEINDFERDMLYPFDNMFYLSESKIIGDVELVKMELKKTIEIYKNLSFENYEDWSSINQEIDLKIKSAANKV